MHSTSVGADPELDGGGGAGWSCMLLLHPAPTCTDAGPDLCTLCLRWLSPAVTYGGGVSSSTTGTKTPLAQVVVASSATCAGGVFPFTHWRSYQLMLGQLALCVVVVGGGSGGGGGGRCIHACGGGGG